MPAAIRVTSFKILSLVLSIATTSAYATDVVVQPSPGSGLVVKDSGGNVERIRIQEDGKITIPGFGVMPQQTTAMCIDTVLGFIGPCPIVPGFSLPYSATASNANTLFDVTQSGNGGALRGAISNSSSTATALTASTSGLGGGIDVSLSNPSTGARGINVLNNGVGPGFFAESKGGNSIWGVVNSISAAAIIGDGSSGEVIVARHNGSVCEKNIGKCAGIGAIVGRHDGPLGIAVRGFVTDPGGGFGVLGQAGISGGTGVAGRFENVNAANSSNTLEVVTNGTGTAAFFQGKGDIAIFQGTSGKARVGNDGKGYFDGGTQTGGADVAELIDFRGRMPQPGDVVEIDPDNALHYRLSSKADSTMVAGVITTKPGVLMNAGIDDATGLPALALVGRVPVKVTMEGGVIRPGDLLVSASVEGRAKRASGQILPGSVIGKALQAHLEGDQGVVEMLVMTR